MSEGDIIEPNTTINILEYDYEDISANEIETSPSSPSQRKLLQPSNLGSKGSLILNALVNDTLEQDYQADTNGHHDYDNETAPEK